MKSILLDIDTWDCVLDINGNIAVASDPYAMAQDAACAIRLFQGECWYDTSLGVPFWATILGKSPPPLSLMKEEFVAAALTVPGVVAARCFIAAVTARGVSGQVQVTDAQGRTALAGF